MNLVLMTQYFDMLKEIGASTRSTAILIPHSPGHLSSLTEQIRNAMIESDQVNEHSALSRLGTFKKQYYLGGSEWIVNGYPEGSRECRLKRLLAVGVCIFRRVLQRQAHYTGGNYRGNRVLVHHLADSVF